MEDHEGPGRQRQENDGKQQHKSKLIVSTGVVWSCRFNPVEGIHIFTIVKLPVCDVLIISTTCTLIPSHYNKLHVHVQQIPYFPVLKYRSLTWSSADSPVVIQGALFAQHPSRKANFSPLACLPETSETCPSLTLSKAS